MVKKRKDVKMNTTISTLNKYDGKEVTLNGWQHNIRSVGKIWFLILRDGTGLVQCVVVNKETDSDTFELESKLTQESSVTLLQNIGLNLDL